MICVALHPQLSCTFRSDMTTRELNSSIGVSGKNLKTFN